MLIYTVIFFYTCPIFCLLSYVDLTRLKGEMKNQSMEIEFSLLGLTDDLQLQTVIFLFLFLSYTLSLTGNVIIILLTLLDISLKTPMYFFLHSFSFLEIIFTMVCIPR